MGTLTREAGACHLRLPWDPPRGPRAPRRDGAAVVFSLVEHGPPPTRLSRPSRPRAERRGRSEPTSATWRTVRRLFEEAGRRLGALDLLVKSESCR